MTAAIAVRDLRKSYGSVEAVRSVGFDVAEGEVFGLLGPNGAGKTTTIKMLVTLLIPTGGTARVLDDVVAEDPRRPRRGDQQRHQHLDRGRLAGAVRAEQAEELTLRDFEVDPAHGLDRLRPTAHKSGRLLVGPAQVLRFDCGHGRSLAFEGSSLHSAARGGVAQLVRAAES